MFTSASLLCGIAPSLSFLIVARAAQGLGAAMMMALTIALVGEAVPKARIGSAMGLLGTMSAVGTTLGPSLGGVLIAAMSWRLIFIVNVPLGILNFWLVRRHVPVDRQVARANWATFDVTGTGVLALTLAAYALAMTSGHGTFGYLNIVLLLVVALGVVLLAAVERNAALPLLQLAIFRDGTLRGGLATSAIVSTVMMTTLVVGPFYLSRGLGLDTAAVGFTMSVGPLVSALTGIPAGRIVDRFGSHRMVLVGLCGMTAGLLMIAAIPSSLGVVGYVGPLIVITADYALFQAANNTIVMKDVAPERRGVISGMLSLSRNLGLVTGAAVMGAVFAHASGTSDVAAASSRVVAAGMRFTYGVAAVLIVGALTITAKRRLQPSRTVAPLPILPRT